MKRLPAWEALWMRVSTRLTEVTKKVTAAHPAAWSTISRNGTDAFPFRAAASFGRTGEPGVEDVVVSVDCRVQGGNLRASVDVARGDGLVLADGPTVEVAASEVTKDLLGTLEPWLANVEEFLIEDALREVLRELADTPS